MLEIFNLMFLGWGLVAVPPDGMDPKQASDITPQILKQLWRFDKVLDLKYLMGRMWADDIIFGPGLVELGVQVDEQGNFLDWGRVDDWKGPEWAELSGRYKLRECSFARHGKRQVHRRPNFKGSLL